MRIDAEKGSPRRSGASRKSARIIVAGPAGQSGAGDGLCVGRQTAQ